MADPRQLAPDHLPTPFTADEIRRATPPGLGLLVVSGSSGARPQRHWWRFTASDADGTTIRIIPVDTDDRPVGPATERRATWAELQSESSFPAATTVVGEDRIQTPLGWLECTRYDVTDGESTTMHWFWAELPEMPVRRRTQRGRGFAALTTVVKIDRPTITEVGSLIRRARP